MKNFGAIILAAGKGKRMKSKTLNKVVLPLGDRPMIMHVVEFIKDLGIHTIVVVVGFAKSSVEKTLNGTSIIYAVQRKRLGTGHALLKAVEKLPKSIDNILLTQGDDAFFYRRENLHLIKKLIRKHFETMSSVALLTIELENPFGVGRILRNSSGKILKIIEEKDASSKQREIKEVYSGCGVYNVVFLKKYLKKIKKSSVTGEYYLVSLIDLAVKNNETIVSVEAGKIAWRGVNTPRELEEARKLYLQN